MGIPTLIKTLTASGDSSLSFVDGTADVTLDSTYDEYMFVCTDMGPATNGVTFEFQASTDSGSNYNTTVTYTMFRAYHTESGSESAVSYQSDDDGAQVTSFIRLVDGEQVGSGADESIVCVLHLFDPSDTTYVKHFYATTVCNSSNDAAQNAYIAGYFNTTSAIDAVSFKMSSGNMDGVIQMYGIA